MQNSTFVDWDFTDTWSITEGESFPSLKSVPNGAILFAMKDQVIKVNELYTETVLVAKMGNQALTMELAKSPVGMTLTNGVISWTPTQNGNDTIIVEVTDDNGFISSTSYMLFAIDIPGIGTPEDPYQISTLENLKTLAESQLLWDKNFIQKANIDASATSTWNANAGFSPIGNATINFT